MKKSKVIIPAMAMILFSTAASVSGTVAWFTANRAFNTTAGNFKVVRATNDFACDIAEGVGTEITGDNSTTAKKKVVKVRDGYALSDASFDHTVAASNIVTPDGFGEKVGKVTSLTQADTQWNTWKSKVITTNPDANYKKTDFDLYRDYVDTDSTSGDDTYVLSAFTWKMTFSIDFSASENAARRVGLYFDAKESGITAATNGDGKSKGFRIAFVPTAVGAGSLAYTKVWGGDRESTDVTANKTGDNKSKVLFIDGSDANDVVGKDLGTLEALYSGTIQNSAGTVAATTDITKTLICDKSLTLPTAEQSEADAKGTANYLGYIKCTPGSKISITFTCVAWYEGTDPVIVDTAGNEKLENGVANPTTVFDTVDADLHFGTKNLTD